MATHPANAKHLNGSAWTHRDPETVRYKHWEVNGNATADGYVTLVAILDRDTTLQIEWRSLRDRDVWLPGWV